MASQFFNFSRTLTHGATVAFLIVASSTMTFPASALDLRLTTDNDFLTNNDRQDDLYTFSLALEAESHGWIWAFRENAFTDREAGLRYDETSVTAGRNLPAPWIGRWSGWVEAGAVHVGEGVLGESVQNSFHDVIGSDQVHLDYLDVSDLHAFVRLELDRQWIVARRWSLGPQLSVSTAPGFKSDVFLGGRGRWIGKRGVEVDFTVGARATETDLALLSPHIEDFGPAAVVEAFWKGLVVRWSLNQYGTGNEHLSLGVRLGGGKSKKREAPWNEG